MGLTNDEELKPGEPWLATVVEFPFVTSHDVSDFVQCVLVSVAGVSSGWYGSNAYDSGGVSVAISKLRRDGDSDNGRCCPQERVGVGVNFEELGVVVMHHGNNKVVDFADDDGKLIAPSSKPRGNGDSSFGDGGNAIVSCEIGSSVAGGKGDGGAAFCDVLAGGVSLDLGGGKGRGGFGDYTF